MSAEQQMPSDLRDLQPGSRWSPTPSSVHVVADNVALFACVRGKPQFYIDCETHHKGRLYRVVANGKAVGRFLNRPDSAFARLLEHAP